MYKNLPRRQPDNILPNPPPPHPEAEHHDHSLIAVAVEGTAEGITLVERAAHIAHQHIPGAIGRLGQMAEVAEGVMHHHVKDPVEQVVCGGISGAVGVVANSIASSAIAIGVGAATLIESPIGAIPSGITAAVVAQPAVNAVVKPLVKKSAAACSAVFSLTPAAQRNRDTQRWNAQMDLYIRRERERVTNPIVPYKQYQPLKPSEGINVKDYLFGHRPSQWEVRNTIRNVLREEMGSLSPSLLNAYLKTNSKLGMGLCISMSEFRSLAQYTGLISSYNNFNPLSRLRDVLRFCKEIGGVASEVGIIEDLVDSEAHAQADNYILCLKEDKDSPLKPRLLEILQHELKEGYFQHKSNPFFSLHFNNNGFLYPVIHPAYENTLVGEIIGLLDYMMKGFLNGGVFDKDFLRHWHETENTDEAYLRAHYIDLKKYCERECKDLKYVSLRELQSRYGLNAFAGSSAYKQPYMTSFRIISTQEEIQREGNIIIPHPSFRVEYSIDLMPDYELYLESYFKEHGAYPDDYQNTRMCYELFAQEIKEKMPKLPMFRTMFQLLGVINSLCYFYATLEKMGKNPVLGDYSVHKQRSFPKSLPSIPVRYFQNHPMNISFAEILNLLIATHGVAEIDADYRNLLVSKRVRSLPEALQHKIRAAISTLVSNQLSKLVPPEQCTELNSAEIDRISQSTNVFFLYCVQQGRREMIQLIKSYELYLPKSEKRYQSRDGLLKQLNELQRGLMRQQDEIVFGCSEGRIITKEEWLTKIPEKTSVRMSLNDKPMDLGQAFREIIANIEKKYARAREQFPEQDGAEKQNVITVLKEKHAAQMQRMRKAIATQGDAAKKESIAHMEATIRNSLNAKIASIQSNKEAQVASVPAHLRAINKQNIDTFCTNCDKEIAEIQSLLSPGNAEFAKVIAEKSAKIIMQIDENIIKVLIENQQEIDKELDEGLQEIEKTAHQIYKERTIELSPKTEHLELTKEAIELYSFMIKTYLDNLKHIENSIHHFSSQLLANPKVIEHPVTKKYNHALIGFTGNDLAKKTGDNFHIVGGCGVSLPNLESTPIPDAVAFGLMISQALATNALCFTMNNQQYHIVRIPVAAVTLEAEQSVAAEVVDSSGATSAHYAAAHFDETQYQQMAAQQFASITNDRDRYGNYPIHAAVLAGNSSVIQDIIAKAPNQLEIKNNRGTTPLLLAIEHKQLEIVQLLVRLGANLNHSLANGICPLLLAVQNNLSEIALFLIEHTPILLNATLDSGMTALHAALDLKNTPVAQALIQKGAAPLLKRKSDGFTALHCAAASGQLDPLKAMHALNPEALKTPHESAKTLLHYAAEKGHGETVLFLLAQGLSLDAQNNEGETPLMLAIKAGQVLVAEILAERSALNAVNKHNQSASLLALTHGMGAVSDILIQRGESPQLEDTYGHTYVYYLVRNGEYHRLQALMSSHSLDLEKTFDSKPLLEIAAQYGQFLIAYEMMRQGIRWKKAKSGLKLVDYEIMADEVGYVRDWLNKDGKRPTAAMAKSATLHGSLRCLQLLLRPLSKEELEQEGVLAAAIESNSTAIVNAVFKKCNDLNKPINARGDTPLLHAIRSGSIAIVELLIKNGADLSIRNAKNESFFHIAAILEDVSLLKRLFKLTKPSDWPADLWENKESYTKPVNRILRIYEKRKTKEVKSTPVMLETLTPWDLGTINEVATELKELIAEQDFDEAVELLKAQKYRTIQDIIRIKGPELVLHTLNHTYHRERLVTEAQANEITLPDPKKLLLELFLYDVNFTKIADSDNPLLALIHADTDELACYRLHVFRSYFNNSLGELVHKKGNKSQSIFEMAISRNYMQLFSQLDDLGIQQKEETLCGLHTAVLANRYEFVAQLLKRYSANTLNHKKQSALMLASSLGNLRMMELLLAYGANPNAKDRYQCTALHHAIRGEAPDAALFLASLMRTPNQKDREGMTPFLLASQKGMLAVVKYLHLAGFGQTDCNLNGYSALHLAANMGQNEVVEFLVRNGFAVDEEEAAPSTYNDQQINLKKTALHHATREGHVETVRCLLSLGASVDYRDAMGNSFFEHAILSNNYEMYALSQELPGFYNRENDRHLLHAAALANHMQAIDELIIDGANLSAVDESGCSALHYASANNAGEVIELLIAGGDIALDLTDNQGNTALHMAAEDGHVRPAQALIRSGAALNTLNRNGLTPLYHAASMGHTGVVSLLLTNHADHSLRDSEGLTAAQKALLQGHIQTAIVFLKAGDFSLKESALQQLPQAMQEQIKANALALKIALEAEKRKCSFYQSATITMFSGATKAIAGPADITQSMQPWECK